MSSSTVLLHRFTLPCFYTFLALSSYILQHFNKNVFTSSTLEYAVVIETSHTAYIGSRFFRRWKLSMLWLRSRPHDWNKDVGRVTHVIIVACPRPLFCCMDACFLVSTLFHLFAQGRSRRESVDSLCRDGADMTRPLFHTKRLRTPKRGSYKPF